MSSNVKKWSGWALAEAGAKTSNNLISKYLGLVTGTFFGAVLSSLLAAIVQTVGGFIGAHITRSPLKVTAKQLAACLSFGVIAAISGWLIVYIYVYPGADIGVVTFIITGSIVPGTIIDRILFDHKLRLRQWLGIIIFLTAGWAILDFPSIGGLFHLPIWVILALLLSLNAAINEIITQYQGYEKVAPIHPMVNNFWVGLTTIVASSIALAFVAELISQLSILPAAYWLSSLTKGGIVIGMISFKLLSYKHGGSIAIKKVVMQGVFLISAVLLGALFYSEPLTFGKWLGMAGFLVAFVFIDEET